MRSPFSRLGGTRQQTFGAKYGQPPGSPNVTSRKAFPRNIPADAVITVSAGAQYSLDGTTWTAEPGVWGSSRFIMCRGASHADYSAAEMHTVTLEQSGGFPLQFPIMLETRVLDFTIWTMDEPNQVFPYTFTFELG